MVDSSSVRGTFREAGFHSSAGFAEAEIELSQFISELVDVVCTYAWNVLQPFRILNSNC